MASLNANVAAAMMGHTLDRPVSVITYIGGPKAGDSEIRPGMPAGDIIRVLVPIAPGVRAVDQTKMGAESVIDSDSIYVTYKLVRVALDNEGRHRFVAVPSSWST